MGKPKLYAFIDEGGNFDFSTNGTRYFTITSVTMSRPFPLEADLSELRFDLLEEGLEIERFHAADDKQTTRDRVFALIGSQLQDFRCDCVIVEKCKTAPSLRELERFYPKMLGYLLQYLVRGIDWSEWSELIVIADRIEGKKKRRALERAVKRTLAYTLPKNIRYRILHYESRSSNGLQIADYFNWAIYRKWTNNDNRSLALVQKSVMSQYDLFSRGITRYY